MQRIGRVMFAGLAIFGAYANVALATPSVYVARDARLTVIDAATNTIATEIPLDDFGVSSVDISPDGGQLLALGNRLHLIDLATNTVLNTFDAAGIGVAFSADARSAYLAGAAPFSAPGLNLYTIDLNSGAALKITDLNVAYFNLAVNQAVTLALSSSTFPSIDDGTTREGEPLLKISLPSGEIADSISLRSLCPRPPTGFGCLVASLDIEFAPDGTSALIPFVRFLEPLSSVENAGQPGAGHFPESQARRWDTSRNADSLAEAVLQCTGDCNADGFVRIDELTLGVNQALGNEPASVCPPFDVSADGSVSISELIAAVNHALGECSETASAGSAVAVLDPSSGDVLTVIDIGGASVEQGSGELAVANGVVLPPTEAVGIRVAPNGMFAYATRCTRTTMCRIDLTTNSVTTQIEVGAPTFAVAFSSDGLRAYVTMESKLLVLDTSDDSIVTEIAIPPSPVGIATEEIAVGPSQSS